MASNNEHRAPAPGLDSIEFSNPAPLEYSPEKPASSGSSGPAAGMDDKNASVPVEQYAVDSEKQSERVGSLRARSESEQERGPVKALWDRHWKKLAQLVVFMLFTASVTPSPQHFLGAAYLWNTSLMARPAAVGGSTASSSTATRTARAG
jgi:CNT family concentrative nucleoside transporter